MPKHFLQLTYQEFRKAKKSLANTTIDKYFIYERIGQGAYGSVYRGMNDETKKQIAVKVLDLVSIEEDEKSPRVQEIRKRLAKTESQLMMKCDSPHVMKCYDVYQNKDLKIMMIQYCNGGTLADLLTDRGKIPERQAIDMIKQIIFGISEMHRHNIIHRDLKTQNIMFHNEILKIVDLGFSKALPSGEGVQYGTTLGTIITMAPEVMKKQKYGLKADIWSIGIILYELIYGRIPYQPMRAPDMYEQIIHKDIFPKGGKIAGVKPSDKLLDFMKKILIVDQNQRLNWKEFLSHPILQSQQKQLPQSFRVSRDISKIKFSQKVDDRTDKQICENLQFQQKKEQFQNQVNISVKWIKSQNVLKQKQQQMRKDDERIRKMVNEDYLECLKTQFILYYIILPIQQRKAIDFKSRNNVQFMYLLAARCFFNMSFINQEVSKQQHELVLSLKQLVQRLYVVVQDKFFKYCQILKKIQDGFSAIISDRFSKVFDSKSMKQKNKFLVGVEGTDFKKQEQIQYTCQMYLKSVIKQLNPPDVVLKIYLELYPKINLLQKADLKGKSFQQKIKQMAA